MPAAPRERFAAEKFVPRPVEACPCGIAGKGNPWATERPREPRLRQGKSVLSRSRGRRQLAVSLIPAPGGRRAPFRLVNSVLLGSQVGLAQRFLLMSTSFSFRPCPPAISGGNSPPARGVWHASLGSLQGAGVRKASSAAGRLAPVPFAQKHVAQNGPPNRRCCVGCHRLSSR